MSSMSEDSNGVPRRKMTNTYTRQDLKNAINLIVERGISIRRAAYMCNVPRTTLATYLKSITHGKVSKLHPDEEQALYQWMTDCCKRGFSIKKRNVDTAAEALVQKSVPPRTHPFQDTDFGKQCYQKFVRRWLSIDRVKDRKHVGVVADWFLHIECFLTESNLFEILSSPNRIFLCDELRFRERVEMQEPVRAMLKKMTMLYTFSAAGEHLSPLLVYPYRRDVPPDIVKAAPKNCAIVAHEYGQVTPKTFAAYLDKVVDKFVTANNITKPVIIFVDESQVDLTLHLHNTCKRLGIVLLGLTAAHVVKPTANVFNDICAGWEQELPQFESQSGRSFTLADCAGLMQTVDQRYIKSDSAVKDETNGTTNETDRKSAHEGAQFTSNTDDEHEGPPDDIDISINFIDFKRAIGKELTEKFERKLETQNRLALTNHAENVLYDIYRQFRCDVVTDSDDDYDIVEIGDD
uniref:HTH psq-type domain-containing protein n=1 Tax=Anopheles atroparvus TaxID=41427 RepID=A0A182J3Q3_ANOAO